MQVFFGAVGETRTRTSNARHPLKMVRLPIPPRPRLNKMVRVKGLEPPRQRRQILSLVRLPIPPHPQNVSHEGLEPSTL